MSYINFKYDSPVLGSMWNFHMSQIVFWLYGMWDKNSNIYNVCSKMLLKLLGNTQNQYDLDILPRVKKNTFPNVSQKS